MMIYPMSEFMRDIADVIDNGERPHCLRISILGGPEIIPSSWKEAIDYHEMGGDIIRWLDDHTKLKQYNNLVQTLEWKPIVTAPKQPGNWFLIATDLTSTGIAEVLRDPVSHEFIDEEDDTYPDATHWMSLPKPPLKK